MTHRRFHLGVFGASGTGKTTYAIKFIAHAPASCRFIFDPDGEFSELMHLAPARTVWELDAAIRSGWVCYDPHAMFEGRLEEALLFFARLALQASERIPGRKFWVVDELGHYVTGHTVPLEVKSVLQTGRHRGLDAVLCAQQPNELHNTILTQLSEVCCFQLLGDEESSLKFLLKFGFDPEEIRRLPPFHWICRNNRGGETRL